MHDSVLCWHGQLLHTHADVRLLRPRRNWTVNAEVPLVEALHDQAAAGKSALCQ